MDRRRFLAVTAAATPLVAGCSGGGSSGDSNGGATPSSSTSTRNVQEKMGGAFGGGGVARAIVIRDTTFQPSQIEVAPMDTVRWANQDSATHTVTSAQFHEKAAAWSMDEQVPGGETATHTFEETGIYEFYCTAHGRSAMCGAVLVGDVTVDDPLPCSGGDGASS